MRKMGEPEMLGQCARYCSAAERCMSEVKKRLDATELDDEAKTRILKRLVEERFIDEARYCKAFVNDKFRFNQWGRIKIAFELKRKGISSAMASDALEAIDPDAYEEILRELLVKKRKTTKAPNKRQLTAKLAAYAASKGFEPNLVFKLAVQLTGAGNEEMD